MLSYFKIFRSNSEVEVKTPFSYIRQFDSTVKKQNLLNFDKDTFLTENLTNLNEATIPEGLWELTISFEIEPKNDYASSKGLVVSWKYGLEVTVDEVIVNDRPAMSSSGDERHTVTYTIMVPMTKDLNLLGMKLTISGYRNGPTGYVQLTNSKIQLYNISLQGRKLHSYAANPTQNFDIDSKERS
jgi:hypothetical protein